MNDRIDSFAPSVAKAWGERVTTPYNRQDHQELYDLFNEQAKQKISYQQLQTQLKNLFQLFGEIQKTTCVSADKIGEKGDESFVRTARCRVCRIIITKDGYLDRNSR